MTMKAPFTRALLSPPPPAAVQLLTRQSVTPLSPAAFLRKVKLLLRRDAETIALVAGLKQINPAATK